MFLCSYHVLGVGSRNVKGRAEVSVGLTPGAMCTKQLARFQSSRSASRLGIDAFMKPAANAKAKHVRTVSSIDAGCACDKLGHEPEKVQWHTQLPAGHTGTVNPQLRALFMLPHSKTSGFGCAPAACEVLLKDKGSLVECRAKALGFLFFFCFPPPPPPPPPFSFFLFFSSYSSSFFSSPPLLENIRYP